LIDHTERTLNAAEIDAVIAQTLAREALVAEQTRRAVWRRTRREPCGLHRTLAAQASLYMN
jgi:hypothetical protein